MPYDSSHESMYAFDAVVEAFNVLSERRHIDIAGGRMDRPSNLSHEEFGVFSIVVIYSCDGPDAAEDFAG